MRPGAKDGSLVVQGHLLDWLLTQARIEHRTWAEDYRLGGIAASQAQIGELEAQTTIIREYQPSMIPSIVQTVAYAREMLSAPGGPVLVLPRTRRRSQRMRGHSSWRARSLAQMP